MTVPEHAPHPVTLTDVLSARERIAPYLSISPMLTSRALATMCGCDLRFKAENLSRTGSFKPHGAFNAILQLTTEQRQRGVATVSAGNHGQAVALAATTLGIASTVFLTETAVQAKVDAIREYGASIDFSPTIGEAFQRLETFSNEHGATIIHPFADTAVIAGQGVVGLEILEQVPGVEQVVIPIGGGGLASGIGIVMTALKPDVRVIGVEPVGAAVMFDSLRAAAPVKLDRLNSIADGLGAPFTTELNLALIREHLADVVLVTDDEILAAMRLLLERGKLLAEPAGAAGLAAVLTGKAAIPAGASTVVVISGGNIDTNRLKSLL